MTLITSRLIALIGMSLLCVAIQTGVAFAQKTDVHPLLTPKNTTSFEILAKPERYQGYDGLHLTVSPDHKSLPQGGCDNCTYLRIDGTDFHNGTIEVDVAGKPMPGAPTTSRGFVGVIFRINSKGSAFEGIYLRPENAVETDQLQRNHSVQYFSYPDHNWKKLRDASPGKYETFAPIKPGAWTHLRIDVEGQTARLYIDGADTPALIVSDLKHGPDSRGAIGLFTEPTTDAYFRNLIITHR